MFINSFKIIISPLYVNINNIFLMENPVFSKTNKKQNVETRVAFISV